jgi:hypothetical protein
MGKSTISMVIFHGKRLVITSWYISNDLRISTMTAARDPNFHVGPAGPATLACLRGPRRFGTTFLRVQGALGSGDQKSREEDEFTMWFLLSGYHPLFMDHKIS